ncbi:MAG: nitroreductase [Pseudomonadales bacterium]|nr:nitroreductase [Pseudomonadales bacterium]
MKKQETSVDAIFALHNRTSSPRLTEPAPSEAELQLIYQAALRAPDHGLLRPWRFLVVKGDARVKLGDLFVRCSQPDSEEKRLKLRDAPLRAPVVIIAVAAIVEHPKVPAIEQMASTAAAVQNMSLAAYALGYGTIWKTGAVAYDEKIKQALGIGTQEEIMAYLYLGSPTLKERPVPVLPTQDFFEDWP